MRKLVLLLVLCISAKGGYLYYRPLTIHHTLVSNTDQTSFPVPFTTVCQQCLAVAITTNGQTAITVTANFGNNVLNNDYIKIDSEIMQVTAGQGTTGLTVTRAQKSTSAATHLINSNIIEMFLANSSNGNGYVQNSSGYDIIVSLSNTCTSAVPFELYKYSATNGIVEIWYNVTVHTGSDDTFYLCFDNSAISSFQGNVANTWPNFLQVWHFGDGTTVDVNGSLGSTSATNHGETAVAGEFSGATYSNFNLSNYIATNDATFNSSAITIEAWVNYQSGPSIGFLLSNRNGGATAGYELYFHGAAASQYTPIVQIFGVSAFACKEAVEFTNSGVWAHYAASFTSSSDVAIYYVGLPATITDCNSNNSATLTSSATAMTIGDYPPTGFPIGAYIDELRISKVVRSADWIMTTYNTVPPQQFSAIGAQASVPTGIHHKVVLQ